MRRSFANHILNKYVPCVAGYDSKSPGFRPTFKYFHWSVSFIGFVWCMGLSFLVSDNIVIVIQAFLVTFPSSLVHLLHHYFDTRSLELTFCSLLAFLLFSVYIKKSRRLAATGMKWGTLGSAVRYNIVSSALTSLAKNTTTASFPIEEGMQLDSGMPRTFSSDGSIMSDGSSLRSRGHGRDATDKDEWVHFQTDPGFHAKNWRPHLLTIVDVDSNGTPGKMQVLSVAAQLQQTGRGINVVISIIDRSPVAAAANIASAVNSLCAETTDEDSVESGLSGLSDRWRNEEASDSSVRSGVDHYDTIKLMRRTKALLMHHMKAESMDGFAEVSTTDGKFFEAVWSAVIHTGLGPLSPNTILLSLPSFTHEHDDAKRNEYLRTINGIINLGKAVILFKGSASYPKNGDIILGRGTIDIWWVVHDGGLLLLIPFLLSKHAVWASEEDHYSGEKTQNRLRRRKKLEAKLRLFAVTTSAQEDPAKLKKAVEDHLERVRIQAEVTVINFLAETDIAEQMRDSASVGSDGIHQNKSSSARGTNLGSNNRLASLAKDGISTQHMTIGEVFSSQPLPEDKRALDYYGQNGDNMQRQSVNRTCTGIQTAMALNDAIKRHSREANLVVSNLPFIRKDTCAEDYFAFVGSIIDGIDNVMLIRGSGAEN